MAKSKNRSTLALLGGCGSVLALAVACVAPSARAQSFTEAFQGTPSFTPGSVTITRGSTDIIEVNGTEAVIDWTPFDTSGTGNINFLPNGATGLFRSNPNLSISDFTVLNRILPIDGNGLPVSRIVELNGTVQSQIGSGTTGGSVWFYAPGGIIAGPNSLFDVGSLVLTSNAIDTTGGLYGSNGEIRFRGALNSNSAVEVQAGARINALTTGSYVALVAPRVVQAGTVNVDGSVAYVGAESADIRINGGLFDITITAGTTDGNGVVHSGTTTGPASTGSGDPQRVFMVAMPKNNALTMLLSGDVGYTPAGSAVQDNSAVILSAGYDIAHDTSGALTLSRNGTGTGAGGFNIGAGSWQSDVTGVASGDILVRSNTSPSTHFLGNVSLSADRTLTLRADQSGVITADKDMTLNAGAGANGGNIDVLTFSDGQIGITDTLRMNASGDGDAGVSLTPLIGANATGGIINVMANGGQISAGSLNADATAYAGSGSAQAGAAQGGAITIGAAGGIITAADIYADASAYGNETPGIAGNATGGSVTLFATSSAGTRGQLSLTGCSFRFSCQLYAEGDGGAGANGGNGRGGSILLYAADADFSVTGALDLHADASGGDSVFDGSPGRSGSSQGGSVTVETRPGTAGTAVMSFGELYASANGGSPNFSEGFSLSASFLDSFSSFSSGTNAGDGGTGTGGIVKIGVAAGSLTADLIQAQASGFGGSSEANCPSCEGGGTTPFQAGNGVGGASSFLITGGTATIGTLSIDASGTGGGAASTSDPQGVAALAGAGIGGTAVLESRGGNLQLGALTVAANGEGGEGFYNFDADGANGGAGFGGTARLLMDAGGSGMLTVDSAILVSAAGKGGAGAETRYEIPGNYRAGSGGSGTGGTVDVTLASGVLTAPSLMLMAEGVGGAGGDNASDGDGGTAGNGTGGTARFAYLNEGHAIGSVEVRADGAGGQAGRSRNIVDFDANFNPIYAYGPGAGGDGGQGTGGNAQLLIDVDPSFGSLVVNANGVGSTGGDGAVGGSGGNGVGGTASFNLGFGTTTVAGGVLVTASGLGGVGGIGYTGVGGRGGDAVGGSATLDLVGTSSLLDAGDISVLAEAVGGDGGAGGVQGGMDLAGANGGNATGGTALFAIRSGAAAIDRGSLLVSGDATGGAGQPGTAGPAGGAGGAGGDATAGTATLRIVDGRFAPASGQSLRPAYAITATGRGGAGADGGSSSAGAAGPGGSGGSGAGGTAMFEASNGDFAFGDLLIAADGIPGVPGAGGATGLSSGGTASFINGGTAPLASGAQRLLQSLVMTAEGATGGRVEFTDTSTAANGGVTINGDLTLAGSGAPVAGLSGVYVTGAVNPTLIGGNASFTTEGPLSFTFTGAGGMNVGGALTAYSGTGISIMHAGRPASTDSLSASAIQMQTPGAINGLTGGALRTTSGDLTLTGQGVSAQQLVAAGVSLLNAGQGALTVSNILSSGAITALGSGISLGSTGAMTIATANASTGPVLLSAGGPIGVQGLVRGSAITIESSDLVLGSGAQIGVAGFTSNLTLRSTNSQQPAYIGGGDVIGGYSLSAAEFGQITAGNIVIEAPALGMTGAPDIHVRDLTVTPANLATGGMLTIATPGRLRVEGALRMTDVAGQGGLTLSAGNALEVIAGPGLVDLRDGNGALAGVLALNSRTIIAATAEAIADVQAASTLEEREQRLARNDSVLSDEGILRAGVIHAHARDGFFIQNTGLSDEFSARRGFTAQNLFITTEGGRTQIAINGRLVQPSGDFVTGLQVIPQVSINGSLGGRTGGFAVGSKINGCLIVGICGFTGATDNNEALDAVIDPPLSAGRIFPPALIELRDFVTQGYPPLIDEPVTGAGNEDLWERQCGGADQPDCEASKP